VHFELFFSILRSYIQGFILQYKTKGQLVLFRKQKSRPFKQKIKLFVIALELFVTQTNQTSFKRSA